MKTPQPPKPENKINYLCRDSRYKNSLLAMWAFFKEESQPGVVFFSNTP